MNAEMIRTEGKDWLIASAAAAAAMCLVLWLQGRLLWCKLGDPGIYVNDAWNSSHTSQHLLDPYTFTHILHGVALFWLAGAVFRNLTKGWVFFVGIAAEAAWEVLENTNYIIEKYRENTASLDYFGDSVANSFGDLAACGLGLWVAMKIGWWKSLLFFVLVELALLLWIRDSLLLNILMLIYPLDSIKNWQAAIA